MRNAKLLTALLLAATAFTTLLLRATATAAGLTRLLAPRGAVARPHTRAKAYALAPRTLTYTVTATSYQAVASQTDKAPFTTADNSRIGAHYGSRKRWMALSRDLLKPWGGPFNYGDKVRVRGISPRLDGVYTVHDTMNRRHRRRMDVLTHTSEKVDIRQHGVKIQLAERAPQERPRVKAHRPATRKAAIDKQSRRQSGAKTKRPASRKKQDVARARRPKARRS